MKSDKIQRENNHVPRSADTGQLCGRKLSCGRYELRKSSIKFVRTYVIIFRGSQTGGSIWLILWVN